MNAFLSKRGTPTPHRRVAMRALESAYVRNKRESAALRHSVRLFALIIAILVTLYFATH